MPYYYRPKFNIARCECACHHVTNASMNYMVQRSFRKKYGKGEKWFQQQSILSGLNPNDLTTNPLRLNYKFYYFVPMHYCDLCVFDYNKLRVYFAHLIYFIHSFSSRQFKMLYCAVQPVKAIERWWLQRKTLTRKIKYKLL